MRIIIWSFLAVLGGGCASQAYLKSPGHKAFIQRDYKKAEIVFSKESKNKSTNQLLFMLDYSMALFAQKKYSEAIKVLLKAEDLAEIKDYTSVSEEFGSLATSDNIKGYKGEDFEKVLINTYLALAFAAQGELESAQVEARKINLLLYRMINEGKRNYQESPFARYLSALLWEASGDINAAYIDYKKTFELDSRFPEIGRDLLAVSKRLGFDSDYTKWAQTFTNETPRKFSDGEGEVVVFFEQGLSPVKIPRDGQNSSLPRFIPRRSNSHLGKLYISDFEPRILEYRVLDIEELSIRYLEDRISRMAAKKMLGLATKGALAAGIGSMSKDSDLGWIAFYAMALSDQADLRSWRTLPESIYMARIPLKAGIYPMKLEILDRSGRPLVTHDFGEVQVKPRKKVFLVGR